MFEHKPRHLLTLALLLGCISCSTSKPSSSLYQGHGSESVSQEVLEKFAPTSQSPELMRKIQSYLDIKSTGLGMLTEDGKTFLYSWTVTGTPQVWKLTAPLEYPKQMTGGEDATQISDVAPDGKFLILSRDRKGEENPGLYTQKINGGELLKIQHIKGVQTKFQYVSSDSRFIYFTSNDQKNDQYTLYKYDLAQRRKEELLNEPGLWFIADVHTDGTLLLGKQKGSLQTEFYLFKEKTREKTAVLGQNEDEEYSAQFGRTSEELLVLTSKFGEYRRLYRYIRNQFYALTPELNYDVSEFYIDSSRTKIFVTTNQRGYFRLNVYNASDFSELKLPHFPGMLHMYSKWTSRNGRFTTLGIETASAPRQNYVLDWNTRKLVQWTLPNTPEINTAGFVPATLEHYPARDGTLIPMFVRRPSKCAKEACPVIVSFHGGPEAQAMPMFSPTIQLYLEEGFILAEPNVRGSDGYGRSWLHADDGAKRLKVITDIEDAAIYIRSKWAKNNGEPLKIGVMGGSYGGYSTLYAMTKFAGAYDAGVATVGMSNLVTFLQNTAPYRRRLRINEYGDPEKDLAALKELSPLSHISSAKAPLLLIQGVSDPRVPVGEALQFHDALKQRNIPVELVLFSDEGHGSAQRKNRAIEIERTLFFFKKYLRGVN